MTNEPRRFMRLLAFPATLFVRRRQNQDRIGPDRTTDRIADRITDRFTDQITERKQSFKEKKNPKEWNRL